MSDRPHVRFSEFEADLRSGELWHRGDFVHIQEKPFLVLAALLERPGAVVTRDELRERLWGRDTFVDFEAGLNTAVYKLREALSDPAEAPRLVETLPKKGYRLMVPVQRSSPAAAEETAGRRTRPARAASRWPTFLALAAVLVATAGGSRIKSASPGDHTSADASAREAFLKGQYLLAQGGTDRAKDAVAFLEQATTLDPGFAAAQAALADALYRLPGPRDQAVRRARAAAERAVALEPGLAEAHHRLAVIHLYEEWDWPAAAAAFERALASDPRSSQIHQSYAGYFSLLGRHDRALAEMQRAIELDPVSVAINADAGWYYFVARRYDEAIAQSQRALELEPRHAGAHFYMVLAHLAKGEREPARAWALRYLDVLGAPEEVKRRAARSDATAGLTRFWEWRLSQAQARDARGTPAPSELALAYAALGDQERAIAELQRAFALHSGWLLPFLRVYPPLDGLRSDSRFQALERSLRFPDARQAPDRRSGG
jgi:DNA-binding winged helix-turn-helix (wHTH) protein